MDGIICINKPEAITSFDVVAKVRKIMNTKKVGHTGTLDPMATGVLIIALNKATKAINYLGLGDKVYEGTCQLGTKTSTGDIWGNTLESSDIPPFTAEELRNILQSFVGKMSQRVPMVSAKKIDGKKLYEYARINKAVETQYTDIEIHSLELIDCTETSFSFRTHVSNGTYIRTLCEDIALQLNTLGTMSALKRVAVGPFMLEDCLELDEVMPTTNMISVKDAISIPKIVRPDLEEKVMNGKRIELEIDHDLVFLDAGQYYAVYKREEGMTFKSQRGLW